MEAVPGARLLTGPRTWRGSAAEFHARTIEGIEALAVWAFEVDRPAIALGSTQRDGVVDRDACAAAGVEVVHRRSGGGVVLLEPGEIVWFDVVVPAAELHARRLGDDIRVSMVWLGGIVRRALTDLGVDGLDVHAGPVTWSAWAPLVCFAGLGPGEVLHAGAKLVGVSQRRTRAGARFQCAVHVRWSPERLLPLLARELPDPALLPTVATLPAPVAVALPAAVAAELAD